MTPATIALGGLIIAGAGYLLGRGKARNFERDGGRDIAAGCLAVVGLAAMAGAWVWGALS